MASLIGTEVQHSLGRAGIAALVREQGVDAVRRLVARAQARWLARFDPDALSLLGFPASGSSYWDAQTVRDTNARYDGWGAGGHTAAAARL